MTYGGVNYVYFLGVKLNYITLSEIFQNYFLRIEISIRPDGFSYIPTLYVGLLKQQIN